MGKSLSSTCLRSLEAVMLASGPTPCLASVRTAAGRINVGARVSGAEHCASVFREQRARR